MQDVARELAEKAGLGYNFRKSFDQADPECRRWVQTPPPGSLPFADAMKQLLDPVWLRYEVEDGKVVLYRSEREIDLKAATVTYSTPRESVQFIVREIATQAGLGYNFEKSFQQTDPECRRFVFDVSMKNRPFLKAMGDILKPVGLTNRIENHQVVLYR